MIGRRAASGLRGPENVGRLVEEGQVGQLAQARGGQGPQEAEVEIFEVRRTGKRARGPGVLSAQVTRPAAWSGEGPAMEQRFW